MTNIKNIEDKTKLKKLCIQLLEEEAPIKILEASRELYQLLSLTSGVNEYDSNYKHDLQTASGKAISTLWAAMSITDFLRTQRFFKGIHHAVIDSKQKYPGEKINILYAGSGPFATLALPVMCFFSSDEISFTLIEIQETSVQCLQTILEYYDFQEHVYALIQTDATSYQLEKSKKIHIVISETMQHSLEKEPQVEISMNLARQIEKDTIWIPQSIMIDAGLINKKKDQDRQMGLLPSHDTTYIVMGNILDLNKDSASKMVLDVNKNIHFKVKPIFKFSKEKTISYPWMALFTTIHIYGNQYLRTGESGLCEPRILADLSIQHSLPDQIKFEYRTGSNPGFVYELLYL
ncbi:MAG: hypothetical protein WAT37_19760 [Saprospiraceae bacterium]